MVPEARVELARLSTTVFETAASAIPPLGREEALYPTIEKTQSSFFAKNKKLRKFGQASEKRQKAGAHPTGFHALINNQKTKH